MRFTKAVLAVVLVVIVTSYGANLTDVKTDKAPPIQGELTGTERDGLDTSQSIDYVPGEIIVKFKKPVADKIRGTNIAKPSLSASLDNLSRKYNVKKVEQVIKGFKDKTQEIANLSKKHPSALTPAEKHLVQRAKRAPKGAKVPDLGSIYKITLGEGQSAPDAVSDYSKNPDVEYAELNYIVSVCRTPNDPNYPVQWALNNTGQMYPASGYFRNPPGRAGCDVNAPQAWDISTGSQEIIVAVIDTGVDYNHRDLQGNMWTDANGFYGKDYVNDDNDPMDDYGHGTHCAGIIAAKTNNSLDIAGVSWNAKIMAVKFLDSMGSGSLDNGAKAITYAVDNGADVLSNSWRWIASESNSVRLAIESAVSQGAIVVAAAGNENNSSPIFYPACYAGVISVAATDSNDDRASFSNYGSWVDIAAPGVDILSLKAFETAMGTQYGEELTVLSGTSMACPHVAGACALLLSVDPYLSSNDANAILRGTADRLKNTNICASGRLDIDRAVRAAVSSKGFINLDKGSYGYNTNIGILVSDIDLAGSGSCAVNLTTDGNDSEVVTLSEVGQGVGIFAGSISTGSGNPVSGDQILQIASGETITGTYYDANDGTGNPATAIDTATADCVSPIISNVHFAEQLAGQEQVITFQTDKLTTAKVICGTTCGQSTVVGTYLNPQMKHTIYLKNLQTYTDYYFKIEATDASNNTVIDDNHGNCFRFTTPVTVPADFGSIQDAIDHCRQGGFVEVSPGTYYEHIDFNGKSITLRSIDPNNWDTVAATKIDGGHTGTVVSLWQDEGESGIGCNIEGLTIRNSGSSGSGIDAVCAAPSIRRCIIKDNGMGIFGLDSFQEITNNIIRNNSSTGICISCDDAEIKSNLISNNGLGISLNSFSYGTRVINNTILNNPDGGIYFDQDGPSPIIKNCIIWDNNDDLIGCTATYSCISDSDQGTGNIHNNPLFEPNDSFYHLTSDSPCINAGNNSNIGANEKDIDNQPRIVYGTVDMGADELIRVYNQTQNKSYFTIQSAINDSTNGDLIIVYPGIYYENIDFSGKSITLRGSNPDNWDIVEATIIDGNNAGTVVSLGRDEGETGIPCNIEGLTIRKSSSSGSGIDIVCAELSIRKCIIEDNGTGIFCMDSWQIIITNNIIRNNSGTGIFSDLAETETKSNLIYNNTYGISLNEYSYTTTIVNNTIVNNSDGGIYFDQNGPSPIIKNCIIWSETPNGNDLINCNATYSCISDGDPGTGNIHDNPLFVLNDEFYHLTPDSPCFNAADSNAVGANETDIDNQPRIQNGRVDMGADEFVARVHIINGAWYSSINSAISAAQEDDVIEILPGTFYESIDYQDKAITIRSTDPNNPAIVETTMIDGSGEGDPVVYAGQGAVLEGLTVQNADMNFGAAIYAYKARIAKCVLEKSVYGVSCDTSIVEGNKIKNTSGGIDFWGGWCVIRNNMIYDNDYGIIQWSNNSPSELINNTVVNNVNAGIYVYAGMAPYNTNCIIWNNGDDLINCSATYSCIKDLDSGQGNIHSDPIFRDSAANDYHITSNSPCIDGGDPGSGSYYAGYKDFDNENRYNNGIDIGADEYWP